MDPAFRRQRERDADPAGDPRLRLKRLKIRAKALEKEEATWAVHEALESLFAAAELLLDLAPEQPDAGEALDHLFVAIAELLDSAGDLT